VRLAIPTSDTALPTLMLPTVGEGLDLLQLHFLNRFASFVSTFLFSVSRLSLIFIKLTSINSNLKFGFCCVNFFRARFLGYPRGLFRRPMNKIVLRRTDLGCRQRPSGLSFLIMCMSSMPCRVTLAERKDLNPSIIGRTIRLLDRWICSTRLENNDQLI